jgi:cysteine-rich repeat protein
MRKSYPSYSLLTLSGLIFAGSCSIIAEVDRTKIPQEGTTPSDGGEATGGSGNRGGTGGAGTGGRPMGGTGGDAGGGGEPSGGTSTGGAAGDAGGGMGGAGMGGAGDGGMGGDPGPACGDGLVQTPETCDDGDMPPAGNDGCSATCTQEPGWTCTDEPSDCVATACGDRIEAGAEACDDGNANSCGTCSMNCSADTASANATGFITLGTTAPADIDDGDYFILNDGATAVEFEFDPADDGVATMRGDIDLDPAGTAAEAQAAIIAAITAAPSFNISATVGTGTSVNLRNDNPGFLNNETSGDFVNEASFVITNMTGGAAHDCAAGVGCAIDADCLNGDCLPTNVSK